MEEGEREQEKDLLVVSKAAEEAKSPLKDPDCDAAVVVVGLAGTKKKRRQEQQRSKKKSQKELLEEEELRYEQKLCTFA